MSEFQNTYSMTFEPIYLPTFQPNPPITQNNSKIEFIVSFQLSNLPQNTTFIDNNNYNIIILTLETTINISKSYISIYLTEDKSISRELLNNSFCDNSFILLLKKNSHIYNSSLFMYSMVDSLVVSDYVIINNFLPTIYPTIILTNSKSKNTANLIINYEK